MYQSLEELQILTGYKYPNKIIEGLRFMGIEHRVNARGFPVVSTSHVEKVLGGEVETEKTSQEPNYGAL